jgi:hypothetical protein
MAINSANTSVPEKQNQDKLARFRRSLKATRDLQDIKLAMGVKGIDFYVKDVEGDWLERWDEHPTCP